MAPQHPTDTVNPDVLELAELLRPTWDAIRARYEATGVPTCDGGDAGDGDGEAGDGDDAAAADTSSGDGGDDAGAGDDAGEQDWKAHSRKHEREAKKARKEADDLRRKLQERENADLSEQERAIATAREEAKNEALSEVEKERRHDRLEVQVTRLASKSFADVDDALLHLERGIARGEIDADDIFDTEGKVQTDALGSALEDLLERKPHLKADPGKPASPGKNDAGKGKGSTGATTVEDELRTIQGR